MPPPALALARPSAYLRDAYRALIAEFVANGDALVPFTLAFENTDFDAFLFKLSDCARGIGVPDGFVAHSTFWLVRGGTHVVGVSNIRQGLGSAILRLSLLRAAELGVARVLVTCGKQNDASAGAILRNGGVLESEEYLADRGEVVQRYWINPKPTTPDAYDKTAGSPRAICVFRYQIHSIRQNRVMTKEVENGGLLGEG